MEDNNQTIEENGLPKNFRIKSVKEMEKLNYSQYEGMITYFREDGVVPDPVRTVEDIGKYHEKAPIYYGRSGEKYGANVHLTEDAKRYVLVDDSDDAVIPSTTKETSGTSDSFGGGLNNDYLASLLDGGDFEDDEDIEEETEVYLETGETDSSEIKESTLDYVEDGDIYGRNKIERRKREEEERRANAKPRIGRASLIQAQIANQKAEEVSAKTTESNPDTGVVGVGVNTPVTSGLSLKPETPATSGLSIKPETPATSGLSIKPEAPVNSEISLDIKNSENTHEAEEAKITSSKDAVTATSVLSTIIQFGVAFLVAAVLAVVLVNFVARPSTIIGNSMNDTLHDGETYIINELSYKIHNPERFDIIVFPGPDGTNYVKRVIGLPGEEVSIKNGFVYINGELLVDDTYGKELIADDKLGKLTSPTYLGDDEYFVLGDNRNNSDDSRDINIGNININKIEGKLEFKIWPLNIN